MITKTLITLSLLAPMAAFASLGEDIARIRPLLPAGTDVAQIQLGVLRGESAEESLRNGEKNYLITDINRDGKADILVITEVNPVIKDYETDQPCPDLENIRCVINYGKRELHLYLGQADGSFKLDFANDKYVLSGEDGGVFGDPLNGLTLKANGAITLSVYGGSAWRWSYADTMQFRNGKFVVIGQDSYAGWTGDLRADTKSVNLITGQVIETHQKDGESPVRTKRYKIAVRPLVKVADYRGQAN